MDNRRRPVLGTELYGEDVLLLNEIMSNASIEEALGVDICDILLSNEKIGCSTYSMIIGMRL